MVGSTKLFSEPLHVGCPNLGDRRRLLARFNDILDCRWLTNDGSYVRGFEERVAKYLEVKHCVAVCNATVGLQLAIRALGFSGEVIVPSFTFPATVHALAWQGIRPVFCDVDPNTHNLDPSEIERLIGPDTSGILGVHVWGNPCAIEALTKIAAQRRLKLLFDAAHAFACSHHGRMIGNFGNAEVFSFHATKMVHAGEGGAITTNDDALAAELRRLRNFGIEHGQVVGLGINGKMSEFAAAVGLTSLDSCDEFIAQNSVNMKCYQHSLAGIAGLEVLGESTPDRRNFQYVVVEVDPIAAGRSRDEIVAALHAENVFAKRYFSPGCHRIAPYRSLGGNQPVSLPQTERLCSQLLQLPTGTAVSQNQIEQISCFLRRYLSHARAAA